MRNLYKYLPIVLLVLLGCGDDENVSRLSDQEFFPLRKGFYQIYDVTETIYLRIDVSETSVYQLKTEVVDSFVNELGGYTYTIHRSKRNTTSDAWEFQQVWSVRMNATSVVVNEESVPFVKIRFPAIENRKWNGNALNSRPADEYELGKIGKSYPLASATVPEDYVQIIQEDSGDLFNVNKKQEVYIRYVGLAYREFIEIEYCSTQGQCDITQKVIDNGTVYVQSLVSYGQN